MSGKSATCQDLRRKGFQEETAVTKSKESFPAERIFMQNIVPPNPVRMCPSLFGHESLAKAELSLFSRGKTSDTKKLVESSVREKISFIAVLLLFSRNSAKTWFSNPKSLGYGF